MGKKRARMERGIAWDSFEWRNLDTGAMHTGEFEDAMFCSLEEIDGTVLGDIVQQPAPDAQKYTLTEAPGTRSSTDAESRPQIPMQKVRKRMSIREMREAYKQNADAQAASVGKPDGASKASARLAGAKHLPAGEAKHRHLNARETKHMNVSGEKESAVTSFDESATRSWAGLQLHPFIVDAMDSFGFESPTPIQRETIPHAILSQRDVIGAAETGSGKTLAYGLPIFQALLSSWTTLHKGSYRPLFALVLTPTRELALQVVNHLNAVAKSFPSHLKVHVVSIVGGMAEEKQKRLLSRKPHIVCATPGRLWELIKSGVEYLNDLSRLRYLVVDEADRMAEEGSFAELSKILEKIKQDEGEAKKVHKTGMGRPQLQRLKQTKEDQLMYEFADEKVIVEEGRFGLHEQAGLHFNVTDVAFDGRTVSITDEDVLPVEFPVQMLTPQVLSNFGLQNDPSFADVAKVGSSAPCISERSFASEISLHESAGPEGQDPWLSLPLSKRQTLLFSATLMVTASFNMSSSKHGKSKRKVPQCAQDFLRALMSHIGIRGNPAVVDLTPRCGGAGSTPTAESVAPSASRARDERSLDLSAAKNTGGPRLLPARLQVCEIRCTSDEKDVHAYNFLLQYPGKALVFVNAISGARRLSNILQALKLPARCLHAQLQQRQRLKTMDFFTGTKAAILVATDVAARGLDVKDIQHVLHYDIPRSTQVFVHRSGRTARASAQGLALSLVTPREHEQHERICADLGHVSLPLFPVDLRLLSRLKERVKLARQLTKHTQEISQVSQGDKWLRQAAEDAGIELDEATATESSMQMARVTGKGSEAAKLRAQLDALLSQPVSVSKRKFVDVQSILENMKQAPLTALEVLNKTGAKRTTRRND